MRTIYSVRPHRRMSRFGRTVLAICGDLLVRRGGLDKLGCPRSATRRFGQAIVGNSYGGIRDVVEALKVERLVRFVPANASSTKSLPRLVSSASSRSIAQLRTTEEHMKRRSVFSYSSSVDAPILSPADSTFAEAFAGSLATLSPALRMAACQCRYPAESFTKQSSDRASC